jgi:hypothetical protein
MASPTSRYASNRATGTGKRSHHAGSTDLGQGVPKAFSLCCRAVTGTGQHRFG